MVFYNNKFYLNTSVGGKQFTKEEWITDNDHRHERCGETYTEEILKLELLFKDIVEYVKKNKEQNIATNELNLHISLLQPKGLIE